MFSKPFGEIELLDIRSLVEERKEREDDHLEYKEKIDSPDKLRKSVTAFANASGGFLIIGVRENPDGTPGEICGVDKLVGNQKVDEWISNVLVTSVEPKVTYQMRVFDLTGDKVVVILSVLESPRKPHMDEHKRIYFVRHSRSSDPATHSEVRDMFEISKRNTNKFEAFLNSRNLMDESSEAFGKNDKSERLRTDLMPDGQTVAPFVLFSFIPRYLDDTRVKTISKEFNAWLGNNTKGFLPAPELMLFWPHSRRVNLHGVVFPSADSGRGHQVEDTYRSYFEVLDNGFFEHGLSRALVHYSGNAWIFNLSGSVAFIWILMNFAKKFYDFIDYYDEVVFQISAINVKSAVLGSFGKKNAEEKWYEPFGGFYPDPPRCEHDRFKIETRVIIQELSEDTIEAEVRNAAEQISRAFGVPDVRCFQDDGTLNLDKLRGFNH